MNKSIRTESNYKKHIRITSFETTNEDKTKSNESAEIINGPFFHITVGHLHVAF